MSWKDMSAWRLKSVLNESGDAYRARCGLALAPVRPERAAHCVRVDGVLLLSGGEGKEGARCERGSGEGLHGE